MVNNFLVTEETCYPTVAKKETTWDGLAPCKQELRWRQSKRDTDAENNFEMSKELAKIKGTVWMLFFNRGESIHM